MVAGLLHPLNIFVVGLGGAFLIPLLYRVGGVAVPAALIAALAAMTAISGAGLAGLVAGGAPVEILTGGSLPPVAINLRLGLPEAVFVFSVNIVALLGATFMLREKYGAALLYLLIVMGIQGMVMTRDLFNLFVFLEIVSIATYGLLSLRDTPVALAATFKYLMATVLASGFFLIGTMLIYAVTGLLNIDDLIASRAAIVGPLGIAGLIFLLACLLLELKPFPANGWGLDVYETARPDIAALISGGVSAGVFFALLKLLPLFEGQLTLIAVLGAVTFVVSNLIGLRQSRTQRLLGYSSIGQMALMTVAAALLYRPGGDGAMAFVIGGLFVNHLFAKVGLFWLAGYIDRDRLRDWALAGRPAVIVACGMLIVAICGLPPFPGFFAKWQLILTLASDQRYVFIGAILIGSLLEVAYMFRWFGHAVHGVDETPATSGAYRLLPVYGLCALLLVSGAIAAWLAGVVGVWIAIPLAGGAMMLPFWRFPPLWQGLAALALAIVGGLWLAEGLTGLGRLYALILLGGGVVVSLGTLYRGDARPGFYPLLLLLLLSLPALPRAATPLEFLVVWELITVSSYLLVLMRREAAPSALRYLLFSIAAAFFLLLGFAMMHAIVGTPSLSALGGAGPDMPLVFVLLAAGFLIKAGAAGVHVWLPGTYADADDDVSALLSAVVSKVAIFGLLVGTYIAIRSQATLDLAYLLGWAGMLTTLVGAVLAVRQDDIKRMLAYSSMSQLGYIVAAIALMSHLGWVTALYLVANHLMVKGILFLAAAAVILRTGTRRLSELGGLARLMPQTFVLAAFAIVAMSGLPPLAGFGGKWLLLSAMVEKEWYLSAAMTLVATFVGFLYMARFIHAVFLGARAGSGAVIEAPVALLLPQYLLVAGIVVVSFFPKLLIEPVSAAIDPQFASTLRWEGMSLELIYAYWNPLPIMGVAVLVSAILFALMWLGRSLQRSGRPVGGIYPFARKIGAVLTPPLAVRFWEGVAAVSMAAGEGGRRIYTGNGQTYNLYILFYLLLLYALGGGGRQLWTLVAS